MAARLKQKWLRTRKLKNGAYAGWTCEEKFRSRYVESADESCWEWLGKKLPKTGYGLFGVSIDSYLAHRVAYTLAYGNIPRGMLVCHRCDNPKCVRPDHLFLGTQTDNMRDAREKGRSRGAPAKFSLDQRLRMCEEHKSGIPVSDIAIRYGITDFYFYKTYRSLTGAGCQTNKLNPDKVRRIFVMHASGTSRKVIAKEMNVTPTLIGMVLRGRIWKHVK